MPTATLPPERQFYTIKEIIMESPVIVALKRLTELGLVEESGERRPGKNGAMQVVWQLSTFGQLVELDSISWTV